MSIGKNSISLAHLVLRDVPKISVEEQVSFSIYDSNGRETGQVELTIVIEEAVTVSLQR